MKTNRFTAVPRLIPSIRRFLLLFAAAFAVVGLGCGGNKPAGQVDEVQAQVVVKEVRQMLDDYQAAVCKDGLLAEFAYLDSSADFYWQPPGADEPMGFDTIAAAIRKNASMIATTCGTWVALEVKCLSIDSASYSATVSYWSRSIQGDSSKAMLIENGNVIRRASGWKLLNGITTMAEEPLDSSDSK